MSLVSIYVKKLGMHAFIESDGYAIWLTITQSGLSNPPSNDQDPLIVAGCWLGNIKDGVFDRDECAPQVPMELVSVDSHLIDLESNFTIEFDDDSSVVLGIIDDQVYGYILLREIVNSNVVVGQKFSYSKFLANKSIWGNPIN